MPAQPRGSSQLLARPATGLAGQQGYSPLVTRDIKQFFSESVEAGAVAEMLVKEVFTSTHPEDRVGRVKVVADELERFVVVVQYGAIAAPSYCTYAVAKKDRVVTVIDDDALYLPRRD